MSTSVTLVRHPKDCLSAPPWSDGGHGLRCSRALTGRAPTHSVPACINHQAATWVRVVKPSLRSMR